MTVLEAMANAVVQPRPDVGAAGCVRMEGGAFTPKILVAERRQESSPSNPRLRHYEEFRIVAGAEVVRRHPGRAP